MSKVRLTRRGEALVTYIGVGLFIVLLAVAGKIQGTA